MGGNLYRRPTNRKNGNPYFNLVKKDIIDSSEHSITLDNGHILRKSDLAIKRKILPSPNKIVVTQPPTGHRLHSHSSLAGKRKLSPTKKSVVTPSSRDKHLRSRREYIVGRCTDSGRDYSRRHPKLFRFFLIFKIKLLDIESLHGPDIPETQIPILQQGTGSQSDTERAKKKRQEQKRNEIV